MDLATEAGGSGAGTAGWLSAEFALGRVLPAVIALLCAVQLIGWVPHYLTWPWWSDHDVFAGAARAWTAGAAPYADYHLNNFPGTIYLFWVLGALFGWERTVPFYMFDAALLMLLGALLWTWSRQVFNASLPGLAAYVLFLSYYLELNYSLTAQRDWHGPFFLVSALLLLQTWPGRPGWIVAGLLAAFGISIRPQVVLFLPALCLALDHQVRKPGQPWRETIGPLILLFVALGAGLVALAVPLLIAGSLGAFVSSLGSLAPGEGYSVLTFSGMVRRAILSVSSAKLIAVPLAVALLWPGSSPTIRRPAIVWAVAYAGALIYGPISPFPHLYLLHPVVLCWSVLCGVLVAMAIEHHRWPATVALVVVLLVLGSGLILRPRFFDIGRSTRAFGILQGTTDPSRRAPLGYTSMAQISFYAARYNWADYQAALTYLRSLPPSTRVGNALYGLPALVGPSGRASVFPAESIGLMTIVGEDAEDAFVEAMRRQEDSVVVWSPAEVRQGPFHPLPRLFEAIETHYEPGQQFGEIEIWHRRGAR